MTTYNNFSLSASKGKLYLKSTTPKEGYEQVIYGVNKDKITYHKYYDSISGVIDKVEAKKVEYQGKPIHFLEIIFKEDGGVINKISVVSKDKGNYTNEARTLISSLYHLKQNEPITVTTKTGTYTNSKGVEKTTLNVYFNYQNIFKEDGKSESAGFIPFSDIPKAEVKEVAGENVYDWTAQTEFYYKILNKIIEKFAGKSDAPDTKPEDATPSTSVEDDDLPF